MTIFAGIFFFGALTKVVQSPTCVPARHLPVKAALIRIISVRFTAGELFWLFIKNTYLVVYEIAFLAETYVDRAWEN